MGTASGTLDVGAILSVAATRHRDREAIVCATTGRRFTYGQLDERANRLANALQDAGFAKGDVVAFLLNNRAEIVETYFALAKAGIVGMPINYRLAAAEVGDLVRTSGACGLIFSTRFTDVAAEVRAAEAGLSTLIGVGDSTPDFARDYEAVLAEAPATEPEADVNEDDPQYFNLTSGTTGTPKTYLLGHYANALAAQLMAHQHDVTGADTVLTALPAFGRIGFGWSVGSVFKGARNVLTDFEPTAVSRLIEDERVTITNIVPTMAQMLLGVADIAERDLSSLRGIVFAGSPLPGAVFEATTARLCPNVYEYYGMQETGIITYIGPDAKAARPDSVGQRAEFCRLRIVGPDGEDVGAGEIGAIIAQVPTATTEYFQNPEKTAEVFRDGWVHTGDLGRLDADGYLYVTGRAKDVIVTGGQNVFATEVEELLLHHPDVADASVIGLPDDLWGEAVTAVIVVRDGAEVTDEALVDYCKESLAGFKAPKRIVRRSEPIPRTPTGKVTKFSLVEEYGEV